jgi:hypothetical protein
VDTDPEPVSQVGGSPADCVDPGAFLSPCVHPIGASTVESADLEDHN